MSNEKIIHISTAAAPAMPTPEDAPALVKKIGKATYRVKIYFSTTSHETMNDKNVSVKPAGHGKVGTKALQ